MADAADTSNDAVPVGNGLPPGVDAGLWAEFQGLAARIHALEVQRRDAEDGEGDAPPTHRVMVELPDEWVLLLGWIARRQTLRHEGRNGPTGYNLDNLSLIGLPAIASKITRPLVHQLLAEFCADELHSLCTGRNALWSNRDMAPAANEEAGRAALRVALEDDELPF